MPWPPWPGGCVGWWRRQAASIKSDSDVRERTRTMPCSAAASATTAFSCGVVVLSLYAALLIVLPTTSASPALAAGTASRNCSLWTFTYVSVPLRTFPYVNET